MDLKIMARIRCIKIPRRKCRTLVVIVSVIILVTVSMYTLEYKLNSELEHPIFGAINPVHNLNTRDWKRTLDNVPETEFPKHTNGQLNGSNNGPRESTLLTDDFYDRQIWTQNFASKTNSLKSHNFVDRFNSKYSMYNLSDKEQTQNVSRPTPVILLTYMRSGSTFTGEILQRSGEAFYVYEPFRALHNVLRGQSVSFVNGSHRHNDDNSIDQIHRESLRGWLTCNFAGTVALTFHDVFMDYGKDTSKFKKCIRNSNISEKVDVKMQTCFRELQEACLRAKFILIKTIRTPMKMALSLMPELNHLKIIHLVRDPRSTLKSKMSIHGCEKGVRRCIEEHCSLVVEDSLAKDQSVLYHSNVLTVKYEDLVRKPVTVAKQIFQFLNLKFTPDVGDFAFNITVGGDRRQCELCRSYWQMGNTNESSLMRVDAWKKQMSQNLISYIQKKCITVLDMYKYS